jgi:nitroreductase
MEVFDAVRTVLAVRNYQDKPVSPEVVQRRVEAERLTGSSMNRQLGISLSSKTAICCGSWAHWRKTGSYRHRWRLS